jgi:hypothetical protein
MFLRASALTLATSCLLSGCVWTSDGGITARYESDWVGSLQTAEGSWQGEPIVIDAEGDLTVIGVPDQDFITLTSRFVAGARDRDDAEAAFEDVYDALDLELVDGTWRIVCNEAEETHGSVVPSSTGCADMVVEIPAGTTDRPLSVTATTEFGGVHASGLTVQQLDLEAPFGVVADVEPVDDSMLRLWGDDDLVSGMCNSWLAVPPDTSFGTVTLDVGKADLEYVGSDPDDPEFWLEVDIRGFDDAPALPPRTPETTWSRTGDGAQVEAATVHAAIGKSILTTGPVPSPDELSLCATYELGSGWGTPD